MDFHHHTALVSFLSGSNRIKVASEHKKHRLEVNIIATDSRNTFGRIHHRAVVGNSTYTGVLPCNALRITFQL